MREFLAASLTAFDSGFDTCFIATAATLAKGRIAICARSPPQLRHKLHRFLIKVAK